METTDEVRDRLPQLETVEGLTVLDRVLQGTESVDISGDILDLRKTYAETKYLLTYKGGLRCHRRYSVRHGTPEEW